MARKKKAKSKLKKLLKEGKKSAKFVANAIKEFPENFEKQGGVKALLPSKKKLKSVGKLVKEATEDNIDDVSDFAKKKYAKAKKKIKKALADNSKVAKK